MLVQHSNKKHYYSISDLNVNSLERDISLQEGALYIVNFYNSLIIKY